MMFRYILNKEGEITMLWANIDNMNMETYFVPYKEKQYGMML